MAAARTVFIDTALSNYQSLAAHYDPAIFNIVLLDNTSPYAGQIQSWMTANGASPADINIVSASASVNGAFTPRVVFVDAGVADVETVIAGVPANATVVVLDPGRDGIQQIRDYLAANAGQVGAIDIVTDLASVDVVSHGAPGEITLGSTVLNADNLASYSSQLASIGSHLGAGGDILLYGCDVASGTVGQQFITALASATGADVAASTDLTGSAAAGGDWTLEASTGTIEAAALNIAGYEGLLGNVQSLSKIALSSDTGSSNSDFITRTAGQTITLTGSINDSGTTRVWVTLDGSTTNRTQLDVTTTGTGNNKVYTIGPVTLLAGAGNSIKIWDGAGQNANLLYTQAYTLDNTPPAAGTLGFSGLSDTGASSSDGITSDRDFSLALSGNEAGSSVVYEVSTDNGATFTTTTALQANLPDHSYQFRAIVTDAAGNSSTTAVAKLTIDSAAPAAGILAFSGLTDSGVGGDGVTNDRTFSLSLSGNEAGSSVVYRVSTDGGATYRDTSASQTNLADGSYKFVAVVSDAAGNSSTTTPINVTIDATAPGAPSITAFSDNSGSTADTLTKDTTPTLTISAEADSTVEVFRNGVSVGTATQTATKGVYTFTSSVLADGSYGFTAQATDAAGNASIASSVQNITVDATAPAPTLSLTTDSGTAGDKLTNDASLTFGGLEAGASRVIIVDSFEAAAYDASKLGDGSHTVQIIDTDAAGNSGTATLSFIVDKTAPTPGTIGFANLLDSGDSGDGTMNDRDFSLTLTGNEDGSSVRYEVSLNGGAFTTTTATQTALGDGSYTFRAIVSDAAGNESTSSTASVTIDGTAPDAPSITAFSENSGSAADTLTKDTTPTLTISAEADSKVEVFRNGVSVGTATQTATKGVYTFTSAILADGSYDFTVQAKDAAGNASKVSSGQNITVDATAPAPTLSLSTDSGAAGDKLTNDASLTFGALESGATRVIKVDNNIVGTYDAGLNDGSHTVEVTDTDAAGNSGTATLTFTLDTTPPTAGTMGLANLLDSGDSGDSITNDRDFNLALTGTESGSSVRYEVSVNGGAFTSTTAAQTDLADGTYSFRAIVSDAAGNQSTSSTASVTIDATAPNAPSITAFSDNSGSTADTLTKDTTPTLTISADADSRVEVLRNGVSVGIATQTATKGIYTFTSAVLADGSYDFTAESTDAAGNASIASATQNITVDATAPAPTLSLTTDSGAAGDKLTNDASLDFGALETGASRVIKVDGGVVGAYDANALADGSHTVEITDTDAADNSATASVTFTLDKTPPAPGTLGFANLLDSGDSSDGLTNDRDFSLALTGNEDGSSVRYEVSFNGAAFTTTSATQTSLGDGSYTFRAIVTDAADNQSISSTASVTIDATAPDAPSITAFSENSGSTADTLTKDTTPTLTISAEADSKVEVFRNGVSVGTATQTATKGIYTFTSAILADGSYDFTAQSTDAAGNTSAASSTQNVTVDATAPAPTLSLTTDSGAAGDKLTNDASLDFGALETGASRVIKVDGGVVGAYDAGALADGTHTVEITDTDAADNSATASVSFTLDKTPPVPGTLGFANLLDSGDSSDGLTNDRDFSLALTGNEDGSSVRYEVSVNGAAFTTTSATQTALGDGSYTFRAIVSDAAGNESTSSTTSVSIDATAPDAPSITGFSDNSGSTSDTLTKDTTPTLTISAEADSKVEVFRNGVSVGAATQTATKGIYTFTSAILADGSYDFTVQAKDAAGNASKVSSAQNITVDATAPAPTLSLTTDSGAAGDKLTNDASLDFGVLETGATRVIKVDNTIVGAYDAGALADGSHTVEITDTDAADNSATASVTFTLDKTPPVPGTLGFANLLDSGDSSDGLTNDRDFSLALTGNEDGSSVRYEVSFNGGAFTTTTATQTALGDGSYTFRAIVTDAADNQSISSTASITIDATAPDAPSITGFSDNSGSAADTLTKDTTPTLTISAEADSKVEVFRNGASVGTATQTATKGVYTFTSAILADGSYDFTVQAKDAAGNASKVSSAQNITVDATAPAPTLSLTTDSGAAGDKLTNDASLTFGALETGATRVIKVDNTIVSAYDPGLNDGSHTVEVTDTDAAANSATTTFTFTLDRSGPVFSSGAKASVAENIGENQLVYKAAAADPHGVSYSLAGVDAAKFAIAADGSVTLKENPNFEGVKAYGFTVVATDSAGNHTDQAVALSITNVNEAPLAKLVPLSTIENAPISFAILDAADDPDAGDKFTLALVNGTAKLASADGKPLMLINPVTKAAIAVDTLSVKASLSADGTTVLITPPEELDWMMTGQAVKASFEFSVTDTGGLSTRDTISLNITGSTNDKGLNLNGGNGADTLSGNTSNNAEDVLMGGNGDDIISGYGGTDALYGGNGDDRLSGGAGIDYLYGDSGNDTLDGGLDGDFIFGGKGNDLLTGGGGADKFVFSPQNGNDRITDFKLSEGDKLFFADFFSSGMTVDSFLAKYVTDTGNDLQINLQGTTITVVGVANVSDLAGAINFGMPV